MRSRHIAIIGAGASGTLLALHLLRESPLVKITLIEKSGRFGPGLAYNTSYDFHLLNVRAENMSAFENERGHFANWLRMKASPYSPQRFVPRRLYGKYLSELIAEAAHAHPEQLHLIGDEAIAIDAGGRVQLHSGVTLQADHVVLAAGNFLPASPAAVTETTRQHARYYSNPWDYARFAQIKKNDDVLIIGSGLTMTDVVLFLHAHEHAGRIVSLCTHGYPPVPHESAAGANVHVAEDFLAQKSLDGLFRQWKMQSQKGASAETLANTLRPHLQQLWQNLSGNDRLRFLAHLRHLWGTARHRVPQECFLALQQLEEKAQLSFIGGRIKTIAIEDGNFKVAYLPRREKELRTLSAQHLINCTGPSTKYEQDAPAFLRDALKNGTLRRDALQLGLDATPEGQLLDADGKIQEKLFAIGPLLRGVLWEITAVPDIRKSAEALARKLVS